MANGGTKGGEESWGGGIKNGAHAAWGADWTYILFWELDIVPYFCVWGGGGGRVGKDLTDFAQ